MCIVIVSKKKKKKKLKFSIWILKIFLVLMRLFEYSPRWNNKRAANAGSVFLPRSPHVCWPWNCPFKKNYFVQINTTDDYWIWAQNTLISELKARLEAFQNHQFTDLLHLPMNFYWERRIFLGSIKLFCSLNLLILH